MSPAKTRFVVLAAPRTGSNWLCSLLDSHPQVLCHHEIFNPKKIIYAVSWHGRDPGLGSKEERDADPLGFLERLWSVEVPEPIVGLKVNRGQDAKIFDAVLDDGRLPKIFLSRRNRVRTYTSEAIALQTGEWESYPWSRFERNKIRVRVEAEALLQHIAHNSAYFDALRSRVDASGARRFELSYEDLGDGETLASLLSFLGADPAVESLSAVTSRQNPAPLRELIANFEELARELAGSDLEAELYA